MISREFKRLPAGRGCSFTAKQAAARRQNAPNTQDMKGARLFVHGFTVNEIKKILKEEGITYKKVRHSGFENVVEIIYSKSDNSPKMFFLHHPLRPILWM